MSEGKTIRGVVVEFDFAVANGAEILFDVAKAQLGELGETLTPKSEAIHLAGGNYHGGIAEMFAASKNKHEPAKAARELSDAFAEALTAKAASFATADFKAFVKTLADKGVKVVVATRADVSALQPFVDELASDKVALYSETSSTYGSCKWDAWRRCCSVNGLREITSVAVTGSGYGVKAALVAGLSAFAVVNPRVEWQDFGGADAVADKLDAAAAAEVLKMLKLA